MAYHFLKRRPGEAEVGMNLDALERTVVPASEVLHIYRPLEGGQIRGQSQLTPAMVRLYLLDSYDDAELDRKRTTAMFSGFITKAAPGDASPIGTRARGDKDHLPAPAPTTLADIPGPFMQGPRETLDLMREMRDLARRSAEDGAHVREFAWGILEECRRQTKLLSDIEREQAIENRAHGRDA